MMSGLRRPSLVGPRDENSATFSGSSALVGSGSAWIRESEAPTVRTFLAVPGEASEPAKGPLFPALKTIRKSGWFQTMRSVKKARVSYSL